MKKVKNPIKPNLYDKVIASIKQHKPKYLESGLKIPSEIEKEDAHRVHIVFINHKKADLSTLDFKITSKDTNFGLKNWMSLKKNMPCEYYVIHDPTLPQTALKKEKAKKAKEEVMEEEVNENEEIPTEE